MCDISQRKNYPAPEWRDPCVRCGYCCTKGPCCYAVYDIDKPYKCAFLEVSDEELGTFSCGIRNAIMEMEKDSKTPMFGEYCSSSAFNSIREAVIERQKDD